MVAEALSAIRRNLAARAVVWTAKVEPTISTIRWNPFGKRWSTPCCIVITAQSPVAPGPGRAVPRSPCHPQPGRPVRPDQRGRPWRGRNIFVSERGTGEPAVGHLPPPLGPPGRREPGIRYSHDDRQSAKPWIAASRLQQLNHQFHRDHGQVRATWPKRMEMV